MIELFNNKLETASLKILKQLQTVEGDREIAKRVVKNDVQAVHYFLGEFSIPFLDYIGKEIMKEEEYYINNEWHYYLNISGDYYKFIGAEFKDDKPTWHKVSLYKGIKNKGTKEARLYTYINTITVRHFIALKKKKDKIKEKSFEDMFESVSISILKEYDGFDEILLKQDPQEYKELDVAWGKLPQKDQLILKYLVIEELNPLEIFDEMIQYVQTTIDPISFTKKQKQDAMSLMKQRAKKHLRELIIELRKQK